MNKFIIQYAFLILVLHTNGQSNSQLSACTHASFHQFDFWIGDWDVYNLAGKKVGENIIFARQDSCLIQENWTSGKNTGTSYNYFDTKDSTWNQVYIDNQGNALVLKGNYIGGRMQLKSKTEKSTIADMYIKNRITWHKDDSGFVHQIWDVLNEKDSVVYIAFDGIYKPKDKSKNPEVTGIGGIFFKSKNPASLKKWYRDNLGLNIDQYGALFEWRDGTHSEHYGMTQWSIFNHKTTYFEPSTKSYMINYRVTHIENLVENLKNKGIKILDKIESYENIGKFVHIMDIEGNKIELWEPVITDYETILKEKQKK